MVKGRKTWLNFLGFPYSFGVKYESDHEIIVVIGNVCNGIRPLKNSCLTDIHLLSSGTKSQLDTGLYHVYCKEVIEGKTLRKSELNGHSLYQLVIPQ